MPRPRAVFEVLLTASLAVALSACAARRQPSAAPPTPVDAAVPDARPDAIVDAAVPDAAPPVEVPADAVARPLVPGGIEGWRGHLGDQLRAAGAVGWASALVVGAEIVDRSASGRTADPKPTPLTTATARPIGTLSRVMTGLLVAALIEEGHLDWGAPATRLRRDWTAAGQAPTVAEMACGCFGVAAVPGTPPQTPIQVLDRLRDHLKAGDTLEAMPTPVMAAAAGYLAALGAPSTPIEPGAAYADQVKRRVAGPLGMAWSVGAPDAPGIVPVFAPDRGGWASVDDLAYLAVALTARGLTPSGGRVVEGAAISEGLAIIDGQAGPATRLGLRVEPRGAVSLRIGGGAAGQGITRLVIADELAWVVRVEGQGPAVEDALSEALDALLAHRYRLPRGPNRAAAGEAPGDGGAAPTSADAAPGAQAPDAAVEPPRDGG